MGGQRIRIMHRKFEKVDNEATKAAIIHNYFPVAILMVSVRFRAIYSSENFRTLSFHPKTVLVTLVCPRTGDWWVFRSCMLYTNCF